MVELLVLLKSSSSPTSGPELVRITEEFETSIGKWHRNFSETIHHDQTQSTQSTFCQHVKNLVEVMGNPFLEESKDLLRLDTRDIMDEAVVSSVCLAEEKEKEQYNTFVTNRLHERSTSLFDPIKKNSCLCLVNLQLRKSRSQA